MQIVKMPEWFKRDISEAQFLDRQRRLDAMPRIKVLFGKDWGYGPSAYSFGVMWDKDPNPEEGAWIYRRRFVLHLTFRLTVERNRK